MSNRRIGLTGASGVLGTRIGQAFERRGIAIDRYAGDVRDANAVAGWAADLDVLIHGAAIVPLGQVAAQLDSAIAVNVAATALIARAAETASCRLVYLSTSHVYRGDEDGLREDAAIAPISLYGLTKLQGEQWVQSLASEALILRIFSYFDARQQPSYLIPALRGRIASALNGTSLDLMGAWNRRDIADASWLADRCAALVEADATGVVNCCTGIGHSVAAIASALASAMGRPDIGWIPVQTDAPNALVGDPGRMIGLVGEQPFDLGAALAGFDRDFAPRPAAEMRFA